MKHPAPRSAHIDCSAAMAGGARRKKGGGVEDGGHNTHGVKTYDRGKLARTVWVGQIADQDATESFLEHTLTKPFGKVEKVYLRRKKCTNAKCDDLSSPPPALLLAHALRCGAAVTGCAKPLLPSCSWALVTFKGVKSVARAIDEQSRVPGWRIDSVVTSKIKSFEAHFVLAGVQLDSLEMSQKKSSKKTERESKLSSMFDQYETDQDSPHVRRPARSHLPRAVLRLPAFGCLDSPGSRGVSVRLRRQSQKGPGHSPKPPPGPGRSGGGGRLSEQFTGYEADREEFEKARVSTFPTCLAQCGACCGQHCILDSLAYHYMYSPEHNPLATQVSTRERNAELEARKLNPLPPMTPKRQAGASAPRRIAATTSSASAEDGGEVAIGIQPVGSGVAEHAPAVRSFMMFPKLEGSLEGARLHAEEKHRLLEAALGWAKHCEALRVVRREARAGVLERARCGGPTCEGHALLEASALNLDAPLRRWRDIAASQTIVADFKPITVVHSVVTGRCMIQLPLTIQHEQQQQQRQERAESMVSEWAMRESLNNKVKSLGQMKDQGARMKTKWCDPKASCLVSFLIRPLKAESGVPALQDGRGGQEVREPLADCGQEAREAPSRGGRPGLRDLRPRPRDTERPVPGQRGAGAGEELAAGFGRRRGRGAGHH